MGGCCSRDVVVEAPEVIIPDPAENEVCQFTIKQAAFASRDYVAYRGHYNEVKLLYEEYNPEKVSRCAGGRETRGALTPAPREDRGDPGNLEEVQGEGGRAGQEAAPEVQGPLPDKEVPEDVGGARGRRGAVLQHA